MKNLTKLTALFILNVILALSGAPQDAQAGELPEVCAECILWYAHDCGYSGGGVVHTFDHDPPQCDGISSNRGGYDADHATVYANSCEDLHESCEGGGFEN